jgi:HD-GYP domain-containing protein (c-di-GMP phosphodiesterase class II)
MYAFRWLALVDLDKCVDILKSWLSSDDDLLQTTGGACAKFLFLVFSHYQSIPAVSDYENILSLAPLLAESSWEFTIPVLRLVQSWCISLNWLERFIANSEGETSEVLEMVDVLTEDNKEELRLEIDRWENSIKKDKQISKQLDTLITKFKLRMIAQYIDPSKKFPENASLGIIVIDPKITRNQSIVAKIIEEILAKTQASDKDELYIFIHHIGKIQSIIGLSDRNIEKTLFPSMQFNSIQLIAPLLELYPIQQTDFIILITKEKILDLKDVKSTQWRKKLYFYGLEAEEPWVSGFTLIPELEQHEEQEITDNVLQYLDLV